ncbi:DUF5916 domain-containing protein [Hyalangium sp.]|uniref:carbohydrate binding family 9 domain-containing protein n=1 Tax=Hyalangium sp. TaxID=2028555 RepID=UPI00389A1B31
MTCLIAGGALAGEPALAPPSASAQFITPSEVAIARLDGRAISLDGLLKEGLWAQASVVRGLTRLEPVEGGPGFGDAEFRIFYDEQALYVGARITQPPGITHAHIFQRDQLGNDDAILVYLKPFSSSDNAYVFKVNPLGIQRDSFVVQDGNVAIPWDGVWDSEGQVLADGYSVELRIPFRTVRFPMTERQDWGVILAVETGSRAQFDIWPASSADRGPPLAQVGTLQGMYGLQRGYDLDLLPSVRMRYSGEGSAHEPFTWDQGRLLGGKQPGVIDPGLDVRYGISGGTVLNLALNPDFSQVEADSDQLDYNLRYPLYLEEKRPFFLEGLDIFETPIPLLYTRSINDAEAGLKLTGKEGRYVMGVLSAWDVTPPPSRIQEDPTLPGGTGRASGFEDSSGKEALTTVGRFSMDLLPGSRVGLFVADKQILEPSFERRAAQHDLVSLDGKLQLADLYSVTAQASFSRTGEVGRRGLLGGLYYLKARREDRRLLLEAEAAYYAAGFRAEASALTRVNYIPTQALAAYKFEINSNWLMYVKPEVLGLITHDATTRERLDWFAKPAVSLLLAGNTSVKGGYNLGEEAFAGQHFPVRSAYVNLETSPLPWLAASVDVEGGRRINYKVEDPFLGRALDTGLALTLRPSTAAQVELSYIKSLFWRRAEEAPLANVNLMRAKVTYNFSAKWSVRTIVQVNTYYSSIQSNLLLAYVYRLGTAVYLGLQDFEPLKAASEEKTQRGVFMKFSYLWQL